MAWAGVQEVEVKVRLGPGEADALRARLGSLGGDRLGLSTQRDTYFAHPSRDLRATDEALRLREEGGVLELAYKGPRAKGGAVKSRREETVPVGADPGGLLEGLGFRRAAEVRKRRESWRLGEATVCIDVVDGLGEFAEVEVVGEDAVAAAQRVEAALALVGLDGLPRVAESYLELLRG